MAKGLMYLLIAAFLLLTHSEAFGSDGKLSSGEFFTVCTDDADIPCANGGFVENTPVFPFNDMLIAKDDSDLFKIRLHTHFLFNHNCHRHVYHSCRFCPKKPAKDSNIHSPDYYIYTLEKIVI
ncbi:MAG: hypothetical protein LBJ47_07370 [Tannerella sp.]|nr:hypothetical protein [Tannerella sp.]